MDSSYEVVQANCIFYNQNNVAIVEALNTFAPATSTQVSSSVLSHSSCSTVDYAICTVTDGSAIVSAPGKLDHD